jgi:hypothetical protein
MSFATAAYVIQVSDRLVTQRFQHKMQDFDTYSNKVVLYYARDAFAAFAYSGPAYIEGLNTDRWIAELLYGGPAFPAGETVGIKFGPAPQHIDIGRALELIRSRLEVLFHSYPATYRADLPVSVAVGGWKWKREGNRLWPFLAKIAADGTTPITFRTTFTDRYWGWEKGKYAFDAIGSSAEQAKSAIKTKLANVTRLFADECEKLLIDVIREASQTDKSVGQDCMSVLMVPRRDPFVVVRYQPRLPTFGEVTVGDGPHKVPLAFWPWVVLSSLLVPPQVQTGGQPQIGIANSRIDFESPPLDALGVPSPLFSTSTQQRPKDPRHRQP